MRRTILLLLILLSLFACTDSRKEEITNFIKEWNGKEILFPEKSVFTIQGEDTVDFSFRNAEYKMVSYFDSLGCISCKLQLDRWSDFIHEMDSVTQNKVPFAMFFHPKDLNELKRITRKYQFDYPVCFDEKDEFNSLNHFSRNPYFQTFLLDKDNKVLAMGNPIITPSVKELYLHIVTGKNKEKTNSKLTELSIDKTLLDFGKFSKHDKQTGEIVITNTGKERLVIHNITTSCGCTQVGYDKRPIVPGKSTILTVHYEAEEVGYFNKTIDIYSNTGISPVKVQIKGEALP